MPDMLAVKLNMLVPSKNAQAHNFRTFTRSRNACLPAAGRTTGVVALKLVILLLE
jgi:hypothetical protein